MKYEFNHFNTFEFIEVHHYLPADIINALSTRHVLQSQQHIAFALTLNKSIPWLQSRRFRFLYNNRISLDIHDQDHPRLMHSIRET